MRERMTTSRRRKGPTPAPLMTRLLRVVRGESSNVSAIIIPTRLAIQPSSLNEGMRSLVSLPPRVFLQSDPEMLHFRVQEALNEANSHILLQRRYVAQEKSLRMDAEKETTRIQAQLKNLNSQVAAQAMAISTIMDELVEISDRARLELETTSDPRYVDVIMKRLHEETVSRAHRVLHTLKPAVDEAKLTEQRSEKPPKSFDAMLNETREVPIPFRPHNRKDGQAITPPPRPASRRSKTMPAPELLLFGDGEVLESEEQEYLEEESDDQTDENENCQEEAETPWRAEEEPGLYYSGRQTEEVSQAFRRHTTEEESQAFRREVEAVREEFSRKQREIAKRIGRNSVADVPRRNLAADLASGGELAWIQALENAKIESPVEQN